MVERCLEREGDDEKDDQPDQARHRMARQNLIVDQQHEDRSGEQQHVECRAHSHDHADDLPPAGQRLQQFARPGEAEPSWAVRIITC